MIIFFDNTIKQNKNKNKIMVKNKKQKNKYEKLHWWY